MIPQFSNPSFLPMDDTTTTNGGHKLTNQPTYTATVKQGFTDQTNNAANSN